MMLPTSAFAPSPRQLGGDRGEKLRYRSDVLHLMAVGLFDVRGRVAQLERQLFRVTGRVLGGSMYAAGRGSRPRAQSGPDGPGSGGGRDRAARTPTMMPNARRPARSRPGAGRVAQLLQLVAGPRIQLHQAANGAVLLDDRAAHMVAK